MTIIVNRHEIILFGQSWVRDFGTTLANALFPFAELPGAYIGTWMRCGMVWRATMLKTYWLGRDKAGMALCSPKRLRHKADLEPRAQYAMEQIVPNGGRSRMRLDIVINSAVIFYVLTFPSADQTYGCSTGQSPIRCTLGIQGLDRSKRVVHRERANCFAYLYGQRGG